MIAHNETGKKLSDAIVDTAYKQMSRHHDLDFTNRQQQCEIELLKTKMSRLEKLIESSSLDPSLPTLNPLQRASKSQHAFSSKLKQRFEGVEEEQEEELWEPSVAQNRKGKSSMKDTPDQYATRLRSSEEPNFQGHLLQNSAIHSKPGSNLRKC